MVADAMIKNWLSLTQAAARLGVHPATLRRWADQAEFPVMLTPGGHRRFALSDIDHFIARQRQAARPPSNLEHVLAEKALSHTRSEIMGLHGAQWLATADEQDRERKRLLGRRLMGLLLQYVSIENGDNAGSASILAEVRAVANEYAHNALNSGLPLTAALQATMFFREALMEVAIDLPDHVKVRPDTRKKLLRRINAVLNVIQLAMAEAYT
ncbi:MAG: helix-turn-helix domain-containing protein [Candidatus Promineifilaceae bacterium]